MRSSDDHQHKTRGGNVNLGSSKNRLGRVLAVIARPNETSGTPGHPRLQVVCHSVGAFVARAIAGFHRECWPCIGLLGILDRGRFIEGDAMRFVLPMMFVAVFGLLAQADDTCGRREATVGPISRTGG